MYTFIIGRSHEPKKANSINKNIFDDTLKFEGYKNVLFNRSFIDQLDH